MKKIIFMSIFAFLVFSGCALLKEFNEIKAVNISMGMNGGGLTIPLGKNGWTYDNIINVSNGIPGTIVDVYQDGKLVATLKEGGIVSITLGSWMCYGNSYYYYPSWQSIPPEQSIHVNVYKVSEYDLKHLFFARDRTFHLHDCNRSIRQSDNWNIQ